MGAWTTRSGVVSVVGLWASIMVMGAGCDRDSKPGPEAETTPKTSAAEVVESELDGIGVIEAVVNGVHYLCYEFEPLDNRYVNSQVHLRANCDGDEAQYWTIDIHKDVKDLETPFTFAEGASFVLKLVESQLVTESGDMRVTLVATENGRIQGTFLGGMRDSENRNKSTTVIEGVFDMPVQGLGS